MFDNYSKAAIQVMFLGRVDASNVATEMMDTQHVLIGIMRVDPETLQKIGAPINLDWARNRIALWHTSGHKVARNVNLALTEALTTGLLSADNIAESTGCLKVRTEHLLLSLMTTPCHAATMLQVSGASLEQLQTLVSGLHGNQLQDAALGL